MTRLIIVGLAAVALSACGGKKESAENGGALDNLSIESAPANDASALEAIESENARQLSEQQFDETETEENLASNAAANESGNSQ